MGFRVFYTQVIFYFILIKYSSEFKFTRTIRAVGLPYYNILLSIGKCKDKIIFKEQKSWHSIKMNRIIDVHYKSTNVGVTVSRAEITLIINNTDFLAFSDTGVGHHEFSASLLFSTNMGLMFHSLVLYKCLTPQPNTDFREEDPQFRFDSYSIPKSNKDNN